MPDQLLVNSVYPIEYFSLPGVDQVSFPDNYWWASKQRFAAQYPGEDIYLAASSGGVQTTEVLELDLGRIREINFINLDVLQAPIDITIEFDAISTPDRTAQWTKMVQKDDLPFDDQIFFDPGNRAAWFNCSFFGTTPRGDMVHTRYLRFTFARRDEAWPTSTSHPFRWPIMVKHLRLGRYVAQPEDTIGPLLSQDTPADLTEYTIPNLTTTTSYEVRQRFRVPSASLRGDVWPNILGFGVLLEITAEQPLDQTDVPRTGVVDLDWSLWDVSVVDAPFKIQSGVYTAEYDVGTSWVDWYLSPTDPIPTGPAALYEFRMASRDTNTASVVFLSTNMLSNTLLPGTFDFTGGSTAVTSTDDISLAIGTDSWLQTPSAPGAALKVASVTDANDFVLTSNFPAASDPAATVSRVYPLSTWDGTQYVGDGSQNLVMRVWADVGDEGRDVLGNSYRYAVRREKAGYVVDGTRAGWMSDPAPSVDAVEALYFDVRDYDPDQSAYLLKLIDGMRIAPRTPGVYMNVYYSQENLQGARPTTRDSWDYMLWTPVSQQSFVLRKNQLIQFPTPIRAAFMKLEFTNLNPLPWRVPIYPPLPPKLFYRFPTWIEDQFNNAKVRTTIEDWWLRSSTPVQQKALQQITDPVREFEYKEREFFAAVAMGDISQDTLVSSSLVSPADKSVLDPVTGAQIFLSFTNQFEDSLVVSVDQNTTLGQMVLNRYDPFAPIGATERQLNTIPVDAIPAVSSATNRIEESYSHIAQTPMRFNRTARHVYRQDTAEFNRKGFFVGIDEVRFIRNDYTVKHDDALIQDYLWDDFLMEENTWVRESESQIADGQTVYLWYAIGTGTTYYEDEPVTLSGTLSAPLQGKGEPISQVLVYSQTGKLGLSYLQNDDWQIVRGTDADGVTTWAIQRVDLGQRLTVPVQPIFYADADVVIGRGKIPVPPHEDAAQVIGKGVISAVEVYQTPTLDAATVIGAGVPSTAGEGPWQPEYGELADSISLGRPSEYGDGYYGAYIFRYPTTVSQTSFGDVVWNNPNRVKADDGSSADVTLGASPNDFSEALIATALGCVTFGTISQVDVQVNCVVASGATLRVALTKDGAYEANDYQEIIGPASGPQTLTFTPGTFWIALPTTGLTPAEANGTGFGALLTGVRSSGTPSVTIDSVKVKVTYA